MFEVFCNVTFCTNLINEKTCREDFPSETYLKKYPGVASCCDVVGYMSDGPCQGTHEGGGTVKVKNFPVCHDKEHTGVEKVVWRYILFQF